MANTNQYKAKLAKDDEFYTLLEDIEDELKHYKSHFKDKVVFCNCDDPRVSNFFKFFVMHFEHYGLKRLIATCYKNQDIDLFSQNNCENAVYIIYEGSKNGNFQADLDELEVKPLVGNGDFRSAECIDLLAQSDIVVTNPPFSLFRQFVPLLIQYNKKFLIIGNQNNVVYKEIFPLIQQGLVWFGYNSGAQSFVVPEDSDKKNTYYKNGKKLAKFGNVCWFTNLDFDKRHVEIPLFMEYNETDYPHYDNVDAIEVNKVNLIPRDYDGVMGVPISFMTQYCPSQFEILGVSKSWNNFANKIYPNQIQVNKDKRITNVTKLNDGAVLKINQPIDKTYYIIGDNMYRQTFPRLFIKKRL